MSYEVRYTDRARTDLLRLIEFLPDGDPALAARVSENIVRATSMLESFPFSCRKAAPDNPFVRELIVPLGISGYVALFEIRHSRVDILAIRHQREDDYFD